MSGVDCIVGDFTATDNSMVVSGMTFSPSTLQVGSVQLPAIAASWNQITNPYVRGVQFQFVGVAAGSPQAQTASAEKTVTQTSLAGGMLPGAQYAIIYRAFGPGGFGPWSTTQYCNAGSGFTALNIANQGALATADYVNRIYSSTYGFLTDVQLYTTVGTAAAIAGQGSNATTSLYIQALPPSSPKNGDMWFDLSAAPYTWRVWDNANSVWRSTARFSYGSTAPTAPFEGDYWVDTSGVLPVQKRYLSGAWVPVSTVGAVVGSTGSSQLYSPTYGYLGDTSIYTPVGTAAAIAGQTSWATFNYPTSGLTNATPNLLYNPTGRLQQERWTGVGAWNEPTSTAAEGPYFVITATQATGAYLYQDVPCYAGSVYSFQALLAAGGSAGVYANCYVQWFNGLNYISLTQLSIGSSGAWTLVKTEGVTAPANTTMARIVIAPGGPANFNGTAYFRRLKWENSSFCTPFSDEATYGATYSNAVSINSLQPAELGANVTETRTSAAFAGQKTLATRDYVTTTSGYGGLYSSTYGWLLDSGIYTSVGTAAAIAGQGFFATQNTADFYSRISGLPAAIAYANLYGGSYIAAAYSRYGDGSSVDALQPATLSADKTSNANSAGFAGQTGWATLTTPTAAFLSPYPNLVQNPTGRNSLDSWITSGAVTTYVGASTDGPFFYCYGATGSVGLYQDLDSGAGITYSIACTINTSGMSYSSGTYAAARAYVQFLDASYNHISYGPVLSLAAGQTWTRLKGENFQAPANTRWARVHLDTYGDGSYTSTGAYWKQLKLQQGAYCTPFSDESTYGARYSDGVTMAGLRPGELGANVTENRTSAAFAGQKTLATRDYVTTTAAYGGLYSSTYGWLLDSGIYTSIGTSAAIAGQGGLATRNNVNWGTTDLQGMLPWAYDVKADSSLPGGYGIKADYMIEQATGRRLASYFPAEYGANVTENRTSASYAGQTPWGTYTGSTNRLAYINDSGRMVNGLYGAPIGFNSGTAGSYNVAYPVTQWGPTGFQVGSGVVFSYPGGSYTLPSVQSGGLAYSTQYSIFYDVSGGSYVAVTAANAPSYYASTGIYIPVGSVTTQASDGSQPAPPAPPPGVGRGCPEPDAPILLANAARTGPGEEIRAGDLRALEHWVWTRHEITGELGAYQVEAVSLESEPRMLLELQDGRRRRYTYSHRFEVEGGTFRRLDSLDPGDIIMGSRPGVVAGVCWEEVGPVVRITVTDARTYDVDGLSSHNIKSGGLDG